MYFKLEQFSHNNPKNYKPNWIWSQPQNLTVNFNWWRQHLYLMTPIPRLQFPYLYALCAPSRDPISPPSLSLSLSLSLFLFSLSQRHTQTNIFEAKMESCSDTNTSTTPSTPLSHSPSSSSSPPPHPVVLSPCAACKILRRRCAEKCVLAPYFPPTEPAKFTIAHRVFGASNIIKFLQVLWEWFGLIRCRKTGVV
jgi:hypothetical protein